MCRVPAPENGAEEFVRSAPEPASQAAECASLCRCHSDNTNANSASPTEFAFDGGRAPFHILTAAYGDRTSALARCTRTTTRRMETEHRAVSVAEGRPGSASECAEVRVLALLAPRRLSAGSRPIRTCKEGRHSASESAAAAGGFVRHRLQRLPLRCCSGRADRLITFTVSTARASSTTASVWQPSWKSPLGSVPTRQCTT
jgi:hypothetical protein